MVRYEGRKPHIIRPYSIQLITSNRLNFVRWGIITLKGETPRNPLKTLRKGNAQNRFEGIYWINHTYGYFACSGDEFSGKIRHVLYYPSHLTLTMAYLNDVMMGFGLYLAVDMILTVSNVLSSYVLKDGETLEELIDRKVVA